MSMHYCKYSLIERNDEYLLTEGDDILISVPKDQGVRLLEYVAGATVSQCVNLRPSWVSDEISDAWEEAKENFHARHPLIGQYFHVNPNTNNPYIYFYTAISDPERIAGIPRDKISRYIENKINADFPRFKRSWIEFCETSGMRAFLNAGYIQWYPQNMEPETLEKLGTILKTGKAARMINDGETDIQVFAGYLQDALYKLNPDKLEVWTDNTPSSIYSMPHDDSITSCMIRTDENDVREDYFEIYDRIPNCSIAVITEDDPWGNTVVMARALIWNDVKVEGKSEKINIMDRIYYASNRYLTAMERWARENGYHRKIKQAASICDFYPPDSMEPVTLTEISIETPIRFTEKKFRFVPYMDTLKYVAKNQNVLASFCFGHSTTAVLIDTEGDGDWLTYGSHDVCCKCYEELDKDHFEYEGDNYCDCCRDDHFTKCEICRNYIPDKDIRNETVDDEDISVCEDCLDDLFWCTYSQKYWRYINTVTVILPNGDKEIVSEEAAEDEDIFFKCDGCGKWFHKDCLMDAGDGWYCEDCEEYLEKCPCCHQPSDENQTWNHTLHMWVCPHCKFESEIQPEQEGPACTELDKAKQFTIYHYITWR